MPGDKKKTYAANSSAYQKNKSKDRKKILVFTLFLRGAGVQLPPAASCPGDAASRDVALLGGRMKCIAFPRLEGCAVHGRTSPLN